MKNRKKSNSIEQQKAEYYIYKEVKKMLGVNIKKNQKIYVGSTYIEPDFYSENDHIIGEIFAHIGKPKSGQNRKVAQDILKMLLLEKIKGVPYKKMIAVCDQEEIKKLKGDSMIAECIRQFDIEVIMIEIESDLRNLLMEAQERQRMVNA